MYHAGLYEDLNMRNHVGGSEPETVRVDREDRSCKQAAQIDQLKYHKKDTAEQDIHPGYPFPAADKRNGITEHAVIPDCKEQKIQHVDSHQHHGRIILMIHVHNAGGDIKSQCHHLSD